MKLASTSTWLFACFLAACQPAVNSNSQLEGQVPIAVDTTSTTAETSPEPSPWAVAQPKWVKAVEPFRIIDNIYFVGTEGLGVFFIPTREGHILIDGGLPELAPMILENIHTLGFDPADVKVLLNTHAHFDHSGGLAALKERTGARMIASEGDRSALEGGFYLGFEDNPLVGAPPVKVDRVIADGETVSLGDVTLSAKLTPGHTRGCTSWWLNVEEDGRVLEALVFCSASVAGNSLINPPQYDGIIDDYRKTFERTADWQPDILLTNHPEFFDMREKRDKQIAGDPLAFVGKDDFPKYIAKWADKFDEDLAKQTKASGQ